MVDEVKIDTKWHKWEGALDKVIDLLKGLKPEWFAGSDDDIEMTEKYKMLWVTDLNDVCKNLGIYFKIK